MDIGQTRNFTKLLGDNLAIEAQPIKGKTTKSSIYLNADVRRPGIISACVSCFSMQFSTYKTLKISSLCILK